MTDRIWLDSYPDGVPADIDPSQYRSLVALMEESFTRYADRTAYSFLGKDVSYADTDRASRALAAYLQSTGQPVPPELAQRASGLEPRERVQFAKK